MHLVPALLALLSHCGTPARTPSPASIEPRVREAFYWVGIVSRREIPICEIRMNGFGSVWGMARSLGVPLWAIERVNRERDLSRVGGSEPIRVPAPRRAIQRRCFTPVRLWRDRPESRPPFYW